MNRLARVGLVLGALTLGGMSGCSSGENEEAKQHRIKGTNHLAKKEFQEATDEYALSLKADPKQEKVWEKKAFAHMQLGQTDQAAESVMKILEMKTSPADKAETYRTLASMYMQGGASENAERYFLEALKLEPKDETSLSWMAEVYAQRGGARSMSAAIKPDDLKKAMEYYDQVLVLNPNSANTYLNKRVVTMRFIAFEQQQKDMADAEAIENAKDAAVVAEAKGRAAEHQKRLDEYNASIMELNKKFAEAQKNSKAQAKNTP